MSLFLKEMSDRYPDNHLVVVLDGAACHRSSTLKTPENMTLVPLPPYSPELNPQENVWGEIKEEGFYNRVFETLDDVEEQLVRILKSFEESGERLKRLSAWDWIISALI
jgi:transposase